MVSIIIPVYNAGPYLIDMLNSVVHQSYKDIEVILVNDGSTDNSSYICHQYADQYEYINVFDRENHGVSATRNFGVEHARGEFIWFMDSDDAISEDAIRIAVEEQQKYDADMVIGGVNFCFTEEEKIISKTISKKVVFDQQQFKYQYKELFSANYLSALWNKLIRRSVIKDNHIQMIPSLCMYEDYVFCMDTILKCKTIVALPDIFYNYKLRNAQSLSHRYRQDVVNMFAILEEKISGYKASFEDEVVCANHSLDDLAIYIGYECVKNEARHKRPYEKVKEILHNEKFHNAISGYRGHMCKYRFVQVMMKYKMVAPLLIYLKISGKSR